MSIIAPSPTSLAFTVRRCEPELVAPTKPTPHEFKQLSDLDDQECFRFQIQLIQFYRCDPSMHGKDPVKIIREALAQALVFYYPYAGRLRKGPGRKLTLECTGEGVIFIEADADVTLEQFGDIIHPPIPCMDQLLYDVPGSGEILDCPLLLIQLTPMPPESSTPTREIHKEDLHRSDADEEPRKTTQSDASEDRVPSVVVVVDGLIDSGLF